MSRASIAPPLPLAPYRGIEPFRFVDQQIFAAREDETWTLLSNVTLYRAVLFYGDSGAGKSSLINAGLLPKALAENYVIDRLRVQPFPGREIKVERISSSDTKSAGFLDSSFHAIVAEGEVAKEAESFDLPPTSFRQQLERYRPIVADEGPSDAEAAQIFRQPYTGLRPLLIFDQFEEFVTLFEEAQRTGFGGDARKAQDAILQTLVALIQDETLPVKIIFVFREDYLAKLSLLFDSCPDLLDQSQRLLPPPVSSLAQIIRAPFSNQQLRGHFLSADGRPAHETGSELSNELAGRIASDLGKRSGPETVNLTELQIVCQRLWHSEDPEKQFNEDGIQGLLKGYGTDVFLHFTPELRDAAVLLLSHMITASNTRNIIEEEDLLSRTSAGGEISSSKLHEALTALAGSQIVRREVRGPIYFYEITSEYLVPWIRERVAERKAAELRRNLEVQHAEARSQYKAERRRARVLTQLVGALLVLIVAVGGLGIFAYWSYREAKAARDSVDIADKATAEARNQLQAVLNAIALVNSSSEDDALQGVRDIDDLLKKHIIPSDMKIRLSQLLLSSPNANVRRAGFDVMFQASQTDADLRRSLVSTADANQEIRKNLSAKETNQLESLSTTLPPRFYIQITDESQRNGPVQQVTTALKKRGYIVPGIQKVSGVIKHNEVRYYRESEPGMPSADEIVSLLNTANVGPWAKNYVRGHENSTKMRPGHFELLFASPPATDVNQTDLHRGNLSLSLEGEHGSEINNQTINITISPEGKSSVINDLSSGTISLSPGRYLVEVQATDYEDYRVWVVIREGATTKTLIPLRRKRN